MNDPWKHLRQGLFGNVEPEVTLTAVTVPMWWIDGVMQGERQASEYEKDLLKDYVQAVPGDAARVSYGDPLSMDRAIDLSRTIRQKGHMTPYEAVQFDFHVSGISKSCGSQLSRHRIGQGHVSSSRRYQEQQPAFVYPMLEYITIEGVALDKLRDFEQLHNWAYGQYLNLRQTGVSKSDARRVIPISSAQERAWWINARALRDFFRLRLARDAEWEIRRLAGMVLDVVKGITPVLFEDISKED